MGCWAVQASIEGGQGTMNTGEGQNSAQGRAGRISPLGLEAQQGQMDRNDIQRARADIFDHQLNQLHDKEVKR